MRTLTAAGGSSLFFAVAPGVVAGVVPWALTGWEVRYDSAWWAPVQVVGALVVAACAVVLVQAFVRFVREGAGTPAPVAPTERLVVGGLYGHVRNPMYVAVVGAIIGQAVLLGQPVLLAYGAVAGAVMAAFVHWHEEPVLAARFGRDYDDYRRAVPAWRPRLRPWH
ncbi:MAG TPA: isoprenylcysteine carboxylmethyltransferase family protein [Acidimicrobiales bacterium]